MKSLDSKQSEQGQVSAPGESSKDEKEIVEERLEAGSEDPQTKPQETAIDQINQILKGWPKERVSFLAESLKHQTDVLQEAKEQAESEEVKQRQLHNKSIVEGKVSFEAPKQTAAEPEPEEIETQEQLQEEKVQPSTGIPFLDELIQNATYPGIAMAYTCLQASWINNELGDKLSATLRSSVNEMLERHRKDDRSLDAECEVLPAMKWLAFLKGIRVSDNQERELREPAEKAIEEEITTEDPQPKEETTTEEPQAEELEDAEPEKESFGFDPKERVRAYEAFEQWLNNRTLDEKRAALALSMLLSKQQYLPDERIGDRLYKQWRDDVLSVSNLDQLQLKGVPGNEAFCQGYLTAMIIMDG